MEFGHTVHDIEHAAASRMHKAKADRASATVNNDKPVN